MNPFFEYLIKSTISLSLLYLLFKVFMQNDKTLGLNRFLLLGILFVSTVIPLLNFQFFQPEIPVKQVEILREFVSAPLFVSAESPIAEPSVSQPIKSEINYWLLIYGAAIFILIIRLFIAVVKVLQLIRNAEKHKLQNIVLAVVKELIQPFTFLNHVVLSEKDLNENKKIIVAHEQAHIKQMHAIDLAVCEVFTLLHFFNPLMWLLRRDLKLNHEYLADQAVLNKGIDAQKYQLLVLQKAVGERRFALANHFSQKPILKRIKMMKKNKKRWTQIKLLLFVPILLLLLQAFARPELISNPDGFITIKLQENTSEKWMERWTMQNIGEGIFQPEMNASEFQKEPNNVLVILMNRKDQYLVENQHKKREDIKQLVKDYLHGINPDGGKGPDYSEKELPFIGKVKVSKGMIVYKHDIASSEKMINSTLQAIGEAYLEVRNEKAQILFGQDYFELEEAKQKAVSMAVPVWFSFDKPKVISNSTTSTTNQKSSKQLNWSYSNLNDIGQKVTSVKVTGENGEYEKSPPMNWSNVLNIIVNGENKIIINGEFTDFKKLNEIIENFVLGKQPDGRQINTMKKEIPYFGEVAVPQGIILFRLDINSSYVIIEEITDKIGEIYLELRDQKSISKFNKHYLSLNEDKRKAIDELIPIRITTAEPKLNKENQQVVFYK